MDHRTLETLLPAYDSLRNNQICIAPKEGTPIAELVQLATPSLVCRDSDTITNINAGTLYDYVSWDNQDTNSQYQLALDGYVKDISAHVKNHLSFFKNVVHPSITDYMEKVNAGWNSYIPRQPGADFEIVQLETPTNVDMERLAYLVKDHDGGGLVPPKQSLMLGAKDKEQLMALCVTGDEDLDTGISHWLSTNDYLECSYFIFLADMEKVPFPTGCPYIDLSGGNWKTNTFQHAALMGLNPFDRLGLVLPAFIMASRLYTDEVDSDAGDMSLSTYREIASQIRDYTGAMVALSLKHIESANQNENIVLDFKGTNVVRVYGGNYKKWLSEGGSVEAIYGLILSSQKYFSKAMLDQYKERLETLWGNHLAIFTTHEQQKSYIVFRELLRSVFLNMMSDLNEQERGILERDPNYVDLAVGIFNNELEYVSSKDMNDLYGVCMRLLTKSRYYYTDAFNFFNTVHTATVTNPNIKDHREAALIGTIDYLINYALDQVVIVK